MATTAESGSGEVLRSERIAAGILPKVLNTFDMVAIFVAIVLFISNSAVMAGGAGPAAYIYWGLGFITFLIPGATDLSRPQPIDRLCQQADQSAVGAINRPLLHTV